MTRCFNRAMFIGYIAKEPDFVITKNDVALCKLDVGVERPYKVKDKNGKVNAPIDFVRVNCWRRCGEIANKYLHKGDLVLVEGEMQCSSFMWEGQRKYKWALECRLVRFLKTQNADLVGAEVEGEPEYDYDGELGSYDVGDVW